MGEVAIIERAQAEDKCGAKIIEEKKWGEWKNIIIWNKK